MSAIAAARRTAAIPAQRQPVASLTQPGARRRTCPSCGSLKVTELTMTLTDGSAVEFLSCHRCEHRRWTQAGRPLDLPVVLDKTRKPA